jgi:hypothetical protein
MKCEYGRLLVSSENSCVCEGMRGSVFKVQCLRFSV